MNSSSQVRPGDARTTLNKAVQWSQSNLFSTPFNSVLTLTIVYVIYRAGPPLLDWVIFSADFFGDNRDDCTSEGACWAVITTRWQQFLFGFYPRSQIWRPILAFVLLVPAVLPWAFAGVAQAKALKRFSLVYPFMAYFLLAGGMGLQVVETAQWGGLTLTLVVAITGIAASLPLGTLLALGRQSELPVVRSFSILFIEFVRGVPLITLLFTASVMLPLFLPEGVNFDKLLRALIIVALFASAYMAEVVRGGLQSIPEGQYESARALGMSYWQMMRLIILPQALRIVIPGIVNTFIGLFKDTSLVYIIGLFDLLGIAQAAVTDANWLALEKETLIFSALIYWIFCFSMSRYSVHLEDRLNAGQNLDGPKGSKSS